MTTKELFKFAKNADVASKWLFQVVTVLLALLLMLPNHTAEAILEPILIVAAIVGVILSAIIQYCQNEGNRALRATQLTEALGVPIGDAARAGYYNNSLQPSITKLAATVFENTLFTTTILHRMLQMQRLVGAIYILLFLMLLAFRDSDINWILLVAQTIFSANMVSVWIRMERFRFRSDCIRHGLHHFFLMNEFADNPTGVALVLAAFSDYECAKDEAAMPLDEKVFLEVNPSLSKKWNQMRRDLKIDT